MAFEYDGKAKTKGMTLRTYIIPFSLTMTFAITCRFIPLYEKHFPVRHDSSSHAQGERQAG